MDKRQIIKFLVDNDLSEVEEIKINSDVIALKFFYDFDKIEEDAAKACASEETDFEEDSTEWITEGLIPYLEDLASDTVCQIIEDAMDEFEVSTFVTSLDISPSDYGYKSFIVLFCDEESEIDLEAIAEKL